MEETRIVIVGAGPAGLVAALAAKKLGVEAEVYEQAPDFGRVGGGILLHSNGLRVLDALDLLDEFRASMRWTREMVLETAEGKRLTTFDYSQVAVPHNQGAVVMRYTLQEHLLAAAERAGVPVHFSHRLEFLKSERGSGALRFENGVEVASRVILACDGIRSRVRAGSGIRTQERTIGEAYLRGIAAAATENSTIREIWGPDGRRFGICPLSGDQTYFFCSVPLGRWRKIAASPELLERWIAEWESFGPDVISLLRAVSDWAKVSYSELAEIRAAPWYRLPVFLVGDAAHAMTPNLGQGANSAMVDALVLMRLLAPALKAGSSLKEVGHFYDVLRRPFVTRIQTASRRFGQMASWTALHSLRDRLLAASASFAPVARSGALLAVGYHPPEAPFLDSKP